MFFEIPQLSISSKVLYEFHIALEARTKYGIESTMYSVRGNLIIANFAQARLLAQKINFTRESENVYDKYVTPGQINALGLLHEIFHLILRTYEEKENQGVYERGLKYLAQTFGATTLANLQREFVKRFPPLAVFTGSLTVDEYLDSETEGKSNKEIILEELLLLHFENINPSFKNLKELFDNTPLVKEVQFTKFINTAKEFFRKEKPIRFNQMPLIDGFEELILTHIDNIEGLLKKLEEYWAEVFTEQIKLRILTGMDLLREDTKIFMRPAGKGTPPVPSFPGIDSEAMEEMKRKLAVGKKYELDEISLSYLEEEKFTEDLDWMPNVVMIAKNTSVWLDQLTKMYGVSITRLDQIPDQELDKLAKANFNALWLIGVWERSAASRKVKQFCGNPDAASSAYSLYDYDIAYELGGEEAYKNLRARCATRGIRLASDMVPNHTGIFSAWMLKNPHFFIQAPATPYPGYTFTGPDLSDDSSIQIRIEDKYYTKQDAAVVFQYINNYSGEVRYIYHGNDGTNMPWNDTAQLNLLMPEVREALIQTIMSVARKFPIIRFDAAMTLAKKHYSRLWFPQPGQGGAIPSRSDYAMTREQFDNAMPIEFWREVVDRMTKELPNTLLLAEAFWLMEGYFVRTLGMHRVYNSAFMHMFMKEENAKYREVIKNTVEFDPEILKRYVNFMSNPDEETAVNQFGKGDKYFGVSAMMATLPGLPMFAHGQIEGFTEKYGMEYKRAYYNEIIDEYLVERHSREIFPLLAKRYLFSEVANFELFDFIAFEGEVNENVFAFTNRAGNERAFVLYNNAYLQANGTVRFSIPKAIKNPENPDIKPLRSLPLSEALQLSVRANYFVIFRDTRTNLEYLRETESIARDGFYASLNGYEYFAFIDFREVEDIKGDYRSLYSLIGEKGVPSIEGSMKELKLHTLHDKIRELFEGKVLHTLKQIAGLTSETPKKQELDTVDAILHQIVQEISLYKESEFDGEAAIKKVYSDLEALNKFVASMKVLSKSALFSKFKELPSSLLFMGADDKKMHADLIVIYLVVKRLLLSLQMQAGEVKSLMLYEDLYLEKPIWQSLIRLGDSYFIVKREFDLLKLLSGNEDIFGVGSKVSEDSAKPTAKVTEPVVAVESEPAIIALMRNSGIKEFLHFNEAEGVKYYNKENFELLLDWLFTLHSMRLASNTYASTVKAKNTKKVDPLLNTTFLGVLAAMKSYMEELTTMSDAAGYRYTDFVLAIKEYHKKQLAEKVATKPTLKKMSKKTGPKLKVVVKKKKVVAKKAAKGKNK